MGLLQKERSMCLRFVLLISLVPITLLLTAVSFGSPDTSADLKDEQAIKELLAQFYAGWNARDNPTGVVLFMGSIVDPA